jgi:quinoprotein relay system zinc metallohydrolase 2
MRAILCTTVDRGRVVQATRYLTWCSRPRDRASPIFVIGNEGKSMPRTLPFGNRIREVFPNVTALLAAASLLLCATLASAQEAAPTTHPRAAASSDDPFSVNEVAPGVFVHQGRYELFTPRNSGDTSNAGFIIGKDAVAVVDTGGSAHVGAQLLAAIRARTKLPIRYVINTHMHPDHLFGNVAFKGESPIFIGHAKLPRALASRGDRYLAINKELLGDAFAGTEIVPPTEFVEDRRELDLGDRKLLLEAHPTAHTDNDLTVLDEKTGTMFLGDLLFSRHIPALDGSIRGWLALIDRLSARTDVKLAVPGHGPASMPWPAAIDAEKRYLSTVAADVRTMIKEGKTLAEAAEKAGLSEKDAWLLFKEYHARNVSAAFAELEWE